MARKKFIFDAENYEACLPGFKQVIDTLVDKYSFFSYRGEERSMRNIDLSIVYWMLKKYKPTAFFESGIWKGRCTFVVAESMKQLNMEMPYHIAATYRHKEIDIIDKDYHNVHVNYMKGQSLATKIKGYDNLGMLIDGPKWRHTLAMKKIYSLIMERNRVAFAVHHDLNPKYHYQDYPNFMKFYQENKDNFACWRAGKFIKKESVAYIDKIQDEIATGVLINRDLL